MIVCRKMDTEGWFSANFELDFFFLSMKFVCRKMDTEGWFSANFELDFFFPEHEICFYL